MLHVLCRGESGPSSARVTFAAEPAKVLEGGVRSPLGFPAPYLDPDHPLLRSAVTGDTLEDARVAASDDFVPGMGAQRAQRIVRLFDTHPGVASQPADCAPCDVFPCACLRRPSR